MLDSEKFASIGASVLHFGYGVKRKMRFDLHMEKLTGTCISKRIHAIVISGYCVLFDGQVSSN